MYICLYIYVDTNINMDHKLSNDQQSEGLCLNSCHPRRGVGEGGLRASGQVALQADWWNPRKRGNPGENSGGHFL